MACGWTRTREAVILNSTRAIGAKVSVSDLADAPFFEPLHRSAIVKSGSHLGAQLSDDPFFDGRLGKDANLGDVMAHGFLAIDVFPGADGTVSDREVHVIRDRDVDGIDTATFLDEEFTPIGVEPGAGHSIAGFLQVIGIDIAEGNHLNTLVLKEIVQVVPAHTPDTDASMVELGVGGNGGARLPRTGAGDQERGSQRGGGGRPKEAAPGNRRGGMSPWKKRDIVPWLHDGRVRWVASQRNSNPTWDWPPGGCSGVEKGRLLAHALAG